MHLVSRTSETNGEPPIRSDPYSACRFQVDRAVPCSMLPVRRSRQMFSNVLRHGESPISAGVEDSALLIRGNLRMIELRAARNLRLRRRRMRFKELPARRLFTRDRLHSRFLK